VSFVLVFVFSFRSFVRIFLISNLPS
jgi:hypothetical protein